MASTAADPKKIEEIADQAMTYLSGAAVSASIFLGDRLGIYRALRDVGRATSGDVAARAGLHERWVREWLHGQVSAGLVGYVGDGKFELSDEQAHVLADEESDAFVGGGFALLFSLLGHWERHHESFRTGRGVPYEQLGADHAVGESRFSTPWMRANLVPKILPELEGVADRLTRGAKVADVGCGSGRAILEMAGAYPESEFHGFDSSETAIRLAEKHLAASRLDNVTFHLAGAGSLPPDESYDFVLTWDCMHDMTDPPGAARAIRRAIKPDGTWLIVDINGKPTPEENYDQPGAALLYAISILDCLSVGTSEEGAAGLGTLGLPEPAARALTAEAGFTRFTPRDFDNPINAFYEVRP